MCVSNSNDTSRYDSLAQFFMTPLRYFGLLTTPAKQQPQIVSTSIVTV